MIQWGRCNRGRVWHLLDQAAADTWCGLGEPIIEWTRDQPPSGGRPCTSCCARVREIAAAVTAAELSSHQEWGVVAEVEPQRVVESVDLVGALEQQNAVSA